MKVNISLLDVDVDTENHSYEVFFLNGYDRSTQKDKSVLRVKYSPLRGIELEIFGYVLLS